MTQTDIPGFQKLNDDVSICQPPQTTAQDSTAKVASPSLIIYCSWMGATFKNIAKYTETYKRLFPEAEILLIQSRLSAMLLGPDLAVALHILKKHIVEYNEIQGVGPRSRSGVILHVSSNGGASNATILARALQQQSSLRLPLDTVILDCSPGNPTLSSGTRAVTLELPDNAILRAIVPWLIYAIVGFYMVMKTALRRKDNITGIRQDLNDPGLFTQDAPRVYLFSKSDALVGWNHVQDHAREAKVLGYNVREEVFEKAPHCALVKENGGRYWKAIQDLVL